MLFLWERGCQRKLAMTPYSQVIHVVKLAMTPYSQVIHVEKVTPTKVGDDTLFTDYPHYQQVFPGNAVKFPYTLHFPQDCRFPWDRLLNCKAR